MTAGSIADVNVRPARYLFVALVISGALLAFAPVPALAHEFGVGKDAYGDFLSGNQAVLADYPILLGLIAAGLFASIWRLDGFPVLWPTYIAGLVVGAVCFAL